MKYPRTYHLPWSGGATSDDKILSNTSCLKHKKIVYLEKLDGENTVFSNKSIHARSEHGYGKPWQTYMINYWKCIQDLIPNNMYICGENVYAVHSINYSKLPTCFFVFAIIMDDKFLSWSDVEGFSEYFGLDTVPVIYPYYEITELPVPPKSVYGDICEGYVVRNAETFNIEDFSSNVAKMVRKNHVQTDERWEKNWKKAIFLEDPIERLYAKMKRII